MKLIADLLSLQDPAKPHSVLTRVIVSLVIVGTNLVYAGFFGVLGAVAGYLLVVELMEADLRWVYLPLVLAAAIGLKNGVRSLFDYWRNYGHG